MSFQKFLCSPPRGGAGGCVHTLKIYLINIKKKNWETSERNYSQFYYVASFLGNDGMILSCRYAIVFDPFQTAGLLLPKAVLLRTLCCGAIHTYIHILRRRVISYVARFDVFFYICNKFALIYVS